MNVVDLHCDTLMALNNARMANKTKSFGRNDLHVDLEKLRKGNYLLQCFAAFVDAKHSPESPLLEVLQEMDVFHGIMERYAKELAPVYAFEDIRKNQEAGKISGLLTIEDGGVTLGDLGALRMFHRLGVRLITLTWNYENRIGHPQEPFGSVDAGNHRGLKEQGIAFLAEMERLGIMVDVSHLSDQGFHDVAKYAKKPFLASHSNARRVCNHPRNLTDDMLRVLAEKGGLVGMNFCLNFLDEDMGRLRDRGSAEAVVDHIQHIKQVAGMDIVALGSDFDGIGETLDLKDASRMEVLVSAMERRGFSAREIEKVFHGNALEFLRKLI